MSKDILTGLPANDYRGYLKHYGVPEQKWGVRRYQNEDGSLTPLGREHYGVGPARGDRVQTVSGGKKSFKGVEALEKGPSAYKNTKAYLKAITKDCDGAMPYKDYRRQSKEWKFDERASRLNSAADLGLKALEKLRGPKYIDEDADRQGDREWFMYEDQTDGMLFVADLINKGYTADQAKKLIREIDNNFDFDMYDSPTVLGSVMFGVGEGNYDGELERFAELCEEVKSEGGYSLDKEIESSLPTGMVKQLTNRQVDVLNANKDFLLEDAYSHLAGSGFGDSDIKKLKREGAQEYRDAFENAFDTLRDLGAFEKPKLNTSGQKWNYQEDDDFKKALGRLSNTISDPSSTKEDVTKAVEEAQDIIDKEYKFLDEFEFKKEDSKNNTTSKKLDKINSKLEKAEEKQSSDKYQKKSEKKEKIEKQLEKLRPKTTKIRDDKIFNDKDPGFFAKMKLRKEARLEKKLAKLNKYIDKVDTKVDKLTKKQEKYKDSIDEIVNFEKDIPSFKNTPQVREAMRIAKAEGWDALTNKQKELLEALS